MRRRRLGTAAACVAAFASALTSRRPAAAAEGVPVEFAFEGCPEELAAPVERIARIELHSSKAKAQAATAVTEIGVACTSDDEVRLSVDDAVTAKRVERTVSLGSVAEDGRARLLALAIAELVRSTWLELELGPPPAPPPASHGSPTVTAPQRTEALRVATEGRASADWRGHFAIEGLFVPTVGRPVVGLGLGVWRGLPHKLFVDGTLLLWDGVTERSSGSITVRQVALDAAVGLSVAERLDVEAGLRGGWASLGGSATGPSLEASSTSGAVVGPLLAASFRVFGPLELWLRTGWLLQGVRGLVVHDSDVLVGDYWLSLGVGLRLGS